MTLTLPGDLTLPASIEIQTIVHRGTNRNMKDADSVKKNLLAFVQKQVSSQMIAGKILQCESILTYRHDRYELQSVLECHEMIARSVKAEW